MDTLEIMNNENELDYKMNNYKTQNEMIFTECIDAEKLHYINDNFELCYPLIGKVKDNTTYKPMTKEQIKTLINKRCKNTTHEFVYKNTKAKEGRLQSTGWNCQGMNKIIRHTIAGEMNYDIDINNCHPVIINWYAKIWNINTPALTDYIDNREEFLKRYTDFYEVDRDTAKERILCLLNDACYSGCTPASPVYELWNEIQLLQNKVSEVRKDLYKKAQEKDVRNAKGICMSHFLQSIENKIFQCMKFYCDDNNIEVSAGCHDGFMATIDSIDEYGGVDKLMKDIEKHVFDTLGFPMKLSSKPMDKGIDIEKLKMENRLLKKNEDDNISLSSLSYIDNVDTLLDMVEYIYNNGLNDYDCAQAYAKFNNNMVYVNEWGWIMYNDKTCLWEMKNCNLHSLICKFFKSAFTLYIKNCQKKGGTVSKEFMKMNVSLGSSKFASGVIKQLDSFLYKEKSYFDRFDSNIHLFCFSDAMCIDLRTFEIRKIVKDDYVMITCGYPLPIKDETNIELAKELIMSICGDDELYKTVSTLSAASLYGKNDNEVCPISQGDGSNGKGVIALCMETAYGNYYGELEPAYFMSKQNVENKPNSHLANCKFARYVNVSEPDTDDKECIIQGGTYKRIGCGEKIQTREMYGKGFTYQPKFILWFQVNDMMKFTKMDEGVSRRLVNIRFPFQFMDYNTETGIWTDNLHNEYTEPKSHWKVKDTSLKTKIKEDTRYRDGLLWLLLDTYKENKGKVYISNQTKTDSTATIQDQNPVKSWFEDNYEPDEKGILKISDMCRSYMNDTGKKLALNIFSRFLKDVVQVDKGNANVQYVRAKRIEYNNQQTFNLMGVL